MNHNEDWTIWLERYRTHLEVEGMAKRTVKERVRLLGKFYAWCKGLGIDSPVQTTLELLVDYRRYRIGYVNTRGRRDGILTVNGHIGGVREFFKFLIDRGVIPMGILAGLRYLKKPRRLPGYTPCHEQVMMLLQTVPVDSPLHVRDRAILELFYSSAIRREELANVCLEHLDIQGGIVRIEQGKGGKDRVVPIGIHSAYWLTRYIKSARPALMGRNEEHRRVFVSRTGRPLGPNAVGVIVKQWGQAAGLEKAIGPHALRRSCATELIRNGANPGHVKDILGHEDFSSLDAYVKLVAADLKEALRRFHPREQ